MKVCISLIFVVTLFCQGCYRMPDEGEISTVPTTNNPKYSAKGNPAAVLTPSYDY